MTKLNLIPGHPLLEKGGLPDPLPAPYALSMDSNGMGVTDFHAFDPDTPLVVVKAAVMNVFGGFAEEYVQQASKLLEASVTVAKRLGKEPKFGPLLMKAFVERVEFLSEQSKNRLMAWDGEGEFNTALPYCVVVEQDGGVDLQKSRPYVQGMVWAVRYKV